MEGQLPTDYIPCINTGPEFHYIKIDENYKHLRTRHILQEDDVEITYQQFRKKHKKVIL